MASGFIVLKDGRALAPRWTVYDAILGAAVQELAEVKEKSVQEFGCWLQTLLPDADDVYDGFGGFIRQATNEHVRRWLDLRELTPKNQQAFWYSLQLLLAKLLARGEDGETEASLVPVLTRLLKMKKLADQGDDPDSLSDWRKGYREPPTAGRIGPGWQQGTDQSFTLE